MKPALKPKEYKLSVAPVKRVLLISAAFGAAASTVLFLSLTTANEFYGRQALIAQEQIAWGQPPQN